MYVLHTKATSLCFCIPLQWRILKSHVRWQKNDKTKHIFYYSNHRRWFLIILFSFSISVKVNYARSNCHATMKLWWLFLLQLCHSSLCLCHNLSGEKASHSEAGLGTNPHGAAVFTGTGVNSRAVQSSTSGLINNDRRVMMWWSTGAQKYYTAGHHSDTSTDKMLLFAVSKATDQPHWQRNSGWNISTMLSLVNVTNGTINLLLLYH